MDNNSVDDPGRNLDLNQEPSDTALGTVYGLGSFLDDLDASQDTEYRIRYLAFLTARARHRQRLRELRDSIEIGSSPEEPAAHVSDGDGGLHVSSTTGVVEGSDSHRGKGCKRDSSHLVAKALEMDSEIKINVRNDGGGSFYDCNLCLYIAREPILTCCGHLFCWACFYKLPYVDSTTKECPVCNGEVTDSTIVPIYGNGDRPQDPKLESSMVIPPRPRAQRIESVRQQHVMHDGFHVPVTEVLRRIRTTIGTIGEETEQVAAAGSVDVHSGATSSQDPPNGEAAVIREHRRPRTRQFSRVLPESSASLSSISAALDSAERLVEDLETFINLRRLQRSSAQVFSPIDEDPMTRIAGTSQAEQQPSPAETNLAALPSSSRTTHVSDHPGQMENPDGIYLGESSAQAPTTTSSRRRTRRSSRLATMGNNNAPQETRRRRRQ